ncbi:FAD-dependent oxidoreductase [Actinomadura logoneensis]|uniref:FAD-dependent oxidoreductase n=1 Tax=Actinomadura logoneensis TaxID=2293572 RepID=A0A372JSE9_9ACTN|nr:FAD-dependent oxidoreductase [Actinomadura logoneensis]RFU42726.1 FAD-dependent oxidoreductase [Actinomadura logoneensis]
MRICVVGAGLAGALLAWRLRLTDRTAEVELSGPPEPADATAASGGLVRGYEPDAGQRAQATASLAELYGSRLLRGWAEYRETGSVYIQAGPPPHPSDLAGICAALPGSAALADAPGFPDRPPAVVERRAGHVSPGALRREIVADFLRIGGHRATASATALTEEPDGALTLHHCTPSPAHGMTTARAGCGGSCGTFDLVVLAAGPWTPGLLARFGLPCDGLRTKRIQYAVHRAENPPVRGFVDETTSLYGRPHRDGLLIGVPSDRYDVDPDDRRPEPALAHAASALARVTFPALRLGPAVRTVVAADCYHPDPGLRLRPVTGAPPRLSTFTGGSGGAAKTALAASLSAAGELLRIRTPA